MVVSLLFMRSMLRSNKIDFHQLAHKAHQREPLQNPDVSAPWDIIKSLFGNQLIFLIAMLSLIVVISLTVIDFTFLSEVKSKYHTDVQLAFFFGWFFGVGRVLAILAKTMLTSRIVQRLGITGSLMLLPLLLFAFTIFILLSEQAGTQASFYLYAFGSMVVFTEILKSTMQDPLTLVLFQPLRPVLRLKGHVISKGIMAPLGLFFAGLFIYINITSKGLMDIGTTCYLLLSMCFAMVVIVYLLNKQYLVSLIESLKSGFFSRQLYRE
jgi:ATP/ADP translocase